MMTPLDICRQCYIQNNEEWEPEYGPEQWEKVVRDQEMVWMCPRPPSPNDDSVFHKDDLIMIKKGSSESHPPSWCPWRVELLMMKDSHPHPGHNI